ncbi:MAG: FtsQ-type POTRA domain-containing protein [Pseudomonadota bacterium]|nr:FtsQ-type POTRA domain-containing protein [Pseudomonadota bacterium]
MKNILFFIFIVVSLTLFVNLKSIFNSDKVSEVILMGNLQYSNEKLLSKKINNFIGKNIYDINLRELKKDIETDFWVESAQITIEKPETLIVSIIEFEPIYICNKTTYVNKEGKQIKRNNTFIKNLLKLNSKTSQPDDMYKLYTDAQNILSQININITEIGHDLNTLDIITTRYRFFVNFDDFERKLREFVGVYDQFLSKSKKVQNIKNIDLRYPTGFAVH